MKNDIIKRVAFDICDNYINPRCGVFGDCFAPEARAFAEQVATVIYNSCILREKFLATAVAEVCTSALKNNIHITLPDFDMKDLHAAITETLEYTKIQIEERIEDIRASIKAECVSLEELAELQDCAPFIDPSDITLLQWAGVPE